MLGLRPSLFGWRPSQKKRVELYVVAWRQKQIHPYHLKQKPESWATGSNPRSSPRIFMKSQTQTRYPFLVPRRKTPKRLKQQNQGSPETPPGAYRLRAGHNMLQPGHAGAGTTRPTSTCVASTVVACCLGGRGMWTCQCFRITQREAFLNELSI